MIIKACLDGERFTQKPDTQTIITIQNRIADQEMEIEIKELAVKVAKGRSFCPTVFEPRQRKKENFKSMQLFALDFDNGYAYEYMQSKFRGYGIDISFSYHSMRSQPEHPKFRIVICHIVPIIERWLAEMMLLMLKKMFPEADGSCFECSRMFLGGKELIECHENAVFRVDQLIDAFQRYEYETNTHNCIREIKTVAAVGGLCLYNGKFMDIRTYENNVTSPLPNHFEENRFRNDSIFILSLNQNSSTEYPTVFFNRGKPLENQKKEKATKFCSLQHIEVDTLSNMCRLFQIFYDNEEDLTHEEHFLLALNLRFIKGFKAIFFDCLERAGSDIGKWRYDWEKIKQYDYKPMSCDECCRFASG